MPKRWTILAMLVAGAALIVPPAMAQETDSSELHPADRALVHGYDPAAMQLLWATWLQDEQTADTCEIEDGETYTYEMTEEGVVIESEEGPVSTDGCALTATDVRGPPGQVNHGTVVSSFVHALKEQGIEGGIGCYVSAIARSNYGKGDQQVKTSDVVSDTPTVTDAEVELTVTEVDCDKPGQAGGGTDDEVAAEETRSSNGRGNGNGGKGNPSNGKGKGKPEWAGQPGPPPHARGGGR